MANDPIALIKRDHEILEQLFIEYEDVAAEDDVTERRRIVNFISKELNAHTEMEETLCYPRFKEALGPDEKKMIDEAYLEHQEAENLFEELKNLDEVGVDFEELMETIILSVRRHMREEENEILPKIEILGDDTLGSLGDDILTFKESGGGATP